MLNGIKRAVFFGAHTDDEIVAAGTLHRLARSGCEVHVVTFGPAAIQEDRRGNHASYGVVEKEWRESMNLIGVAQRTLLGYVPSATLHERGQEVADEAFGYVEHHKPDLCFILSPEDENPAHAEVGRQCERVMRGRVPHVVRCQFPWNYATGRPNLFVKLEEEDLRVKKAVIDAYQSQKFRYRYSDILMNYAIADGLSLKVEAVEKFELIRAVI